MTNNAKRLYKIWAIDFCGEYEKVYEIIRIFAEENNMTYQQACLDSDMNAFLDYIGW